MQLKLERLDEHLSKRLSPLYLIHGDEPLLQLEAADSICLAARRAGCDERQIFVVESGFNWTELVASSQNLSLFGTRKIIDLRIPTGKPGVEGARVLTEYAKRLNADNVTLVALPKLERAVLGSEWFAALEARAVTIAVAALDLDAMRAWIRTRLERHGLGIDAQGLSQIADRTEGNLLAARQEIDKLALLFPGRRLTRDDIDAAVSDLARYEVAQLSQAWLEGDAPRTCRILVGLRAEGASVQYLLWQLAEDVHALWQVADALARGAPLAQVLRESRVWGPRQKAIEGAARRLGRDQLENVLGAVARLDAVSKGIGRGDVWDELRACALELAGFQTAATRAARAMA